MRGTAEPEIADRAAPHGGRTVTVVVAAGLGVGLAALWAGLGFLAVGFVGTTVIAALITTVGHTRRSRRRLGGLLVAFLALGALLGLGASDYEWVPDPFGRSPVPENADVACGAVLTPGPDDQMGCGAWRRDRGIEALTFALLGIGTLVITIRDHLGPLRPEPVADDPS